MKGLQPLLQGSTCVPLASVFDPLSMWAAEDLGFKAAILAGSVASLSVLGMPDLVLLTLSELAEQVRRITRSGTGPPLLVDADHGFGNALNARRTVIELEAAGAAGITLEDTVLPRAYGSEGLEIISAAEAEAKLHAALAARRDPAFAIFGRTSAYNASGIDAAAERIRLYAATGVDGVFVPGLRTMDEVRQVAAAAGGLPLIAYETGPETSDPGQLADAGVRLLIRGHAPMLAAIEAASEALAAQLRGGPGHVPRDPGLVARLSDADGFAAATARYLTPDRDLP